MNNVMEMVKENAAEKVQPVKFVNLTPHPVHLIGDNGAVITFAESGVVARVDIRKSRKMTTVEIAAGIHLNMEITEVDHGEVANLPEPQDGVVYIVSSYVAGHVKRPDCIAPNTDNSAVKDEQGKVKGVRGFQVFV